MPLSEAAKQDLITSTRELLEDGGVELMIKMMPGFVPKARYMLATQSHAYPPAQLGILQEFVDNQQEVEQIIATMSGLTG